MQALLALGPVPQGHGGQEEKKEGVLTAAGGDGLERQGTGWTPRRPEPLLACGVREQQVPPRTGSFKNLPHKSSEEGHPQGLSICTGLRTGLTSKGTPGSQPSEAPQGAQSPDLKEGRGPGCPDHSPEVNGTVGFPSPTPPSSTH